MVAFVLLSGILTGIAENKLAPGFQARPPAGPISLQDSVPGSDPVNVKQEYFILLRRKRQETFEKLLQIIRSNLGKGDQDIIDKVQAADDTKYLARSIVLMWYLGAWYDPDNLKAFEQNPALQPFFEVISPSAYTQSWTLKVAQAHPMGFSEMQFGYWTRNPNPIESFIGKRTV
jgi:hypothetical protein